MLGSTIRRLSSNNPAARKQAAEKLLRQVLEGRGDKIVQALRTSIEKKGSDVLNPLVEKLGEGLYRDTAGRLLVKIGAPSVPALLRSLSDGNSYVQERAANALGEIGDSRAIQGLRNLLADGTLDVRQAAIYALRKIGPAAMPVLESALLHKDQRLRELAANALAGFGWQPESDSERAQQAVALARWDEAVSFGAVALPALLVALEGDRDGASGHAAAAIAKIKDPQAAQLLLDSLKTLYFDKHKPVIEALRNLGHEALPALLIGLTDEDKTVRRVAAEILADNKDKRAIEPLRAALLSDKNNFAIRSAAAEALQSMGWAPPDESERAWFTAALVSARHLPEQALLDLGSAAVAPLVAELDELSYVTVYSAARMLGKIGDARAVEPLIAALTDPTEDVQREAAKALARIGDPRAIEPLATALDNSRAPIAVAEALARLGDTRGADKLVSLCQTEQHANDAISALGDILENLAHAVSPEALAAITSLAPVRQIRWLTDVAGCTYDSQTDSVDVSNVRQLARQELIRRGLEA